MSEYDISEKYKNIKRGLRKLGLLYEHAAKHDVATCPGTGCKTTVPRHSELSKFTVGSIVDFLFENGYSEDDIKKAFKWK